MAAFWREIFGDERPVEIEIGPGTGTFILAAARHFPYINFFGIESSRSRAQRIEQAVQAHNLCNVRILNADAACVVRTIVPTASVAAYHIYFPDPWWKRRHHRRRLFTPALVAALARTLVPGGRLFSATDVGEVYALLVQTIDASGSFAPESGSRSIRSGHTTFERKGLARGARIHEAAFVRHGAGADPTSSAAPITPADSPSTLRRSGVRSSSLNT
jgi:tRNA (guanine-N7-)-methyltransferase